MRSSRRKRNQYVVDLRDTVYELKQRRHEAITQNQLLKQLSGLWERLCSEVESEIQDGVRQQLNFNLPSFEETRVRSPAGQIPSFEEAMTNNKRISPAENLEINTKLNSIRNYTHDNQQQFHQGNNETPFERPVGNDTQFERLDVNDTSFERCESKEDDDDAITNIASNLSKESVSGPITVDADIMANLLLTNTTDGVLHFDTNDRGAMEL